MEQDAESDHTPNLLPKYIIFVASWAIAGLIPPIFVERTEHSTRVVWFIYVGMFVFFGLIGIAGTFGNVEPRPSTWSRRSLAAFSLVPVAMALASVAIVNVTDPSSVAGLAARKLVTVVEPILPWIQNFRETRLLSNISDLDGLKIEAVNALWFSLGLALCMLVVFLRLYRRFIEVDRSWPALDKVDPRFGSKSGLFVVFSTLFAIYCSLAAYSGWFEFDSDYKPRDCLFQTRCYHENDLLVIASAAMLRCFGLFGFPAGAAIGLRQFLRQRLE